MSFGGPNASTGGEIDTLRYVCHCTLSFIKADYADCLVMMLALMIRDCGSPRHTLGTTTISRPLSMNGFAKHSVSVHITYGFLPGS